MNNLKVLQSLTQIAADKYLYSSLLQKKHYICLENDSIEVSFKNYKTLVLHGSVLQYQNMLQNRKNKLKIGKIKSKSILNAYKISNNLKI